jgi:hypothetical protein
MDDAEAERLVDELLSGEPESESLSDKASEILEKLRRSQEAFVQASKDFECSQEEEKLNESLAWQKLRNEIPPLRKLMGAIRSGEKVIDEVDFESIRNFVGLFSIVNRAYERSKPQLLDDLHCDNTVRRNIARGLRDTIHEVRATMPALIEIIEAGRRRKTKKDQIAALRQLNRQHKLSYLGRQRLKFTRRRLIWWKRCKRFARRHPLFTLVVIVIAIIVVIGQVVNFCFSILH